MTSKQPTHVRIGRIQDQVERLKSDAEEALFLSERYTKEGNIQMATYWKGYYDYADKVIRRLNVAFNLQMIEI